MPHVEASRGAKAHAKSAGTKQQTKSSKPRGKGSALQEATEDDGSNPRFAVREHSPDTVAEARAKHDGSHSEEAAGERTPLPSEGGHESMHSLGSGHGGHSPMSPADEAMDPSNIRADEDDKPRRAAKAAAEQSKHTKKRHASKSPRHEALETEVDPYKDLFASDSDEEEEEGAVTEPQEISNDLDRHQDFQAAERVRGRSTTARLFAKEERHTREGIGLQSLAPGAYERTLVQRNPLFTENIEAARCGLLAPHRIPLKEFTTRRKKPENRGGLHPVWGYPWVCPENWQSWGAADLLFWKWVASHSYSQEKPLGFASGPLEADICLSSCQPDLTTLHSGRRSW
ncbi:hypothetical protein PC129_g16564 [Phytophthora cactorum]|uniref:Uncharacterized protein n=1 Tax=Phytophthora cactorum TaxID=29920 RepID=A0A8T1BC75_9STRA|nr:hypothetical protein PC114_g18577 [Phytophthora cactorum]KAG2897254.1 hypothetical protein PC115_g17253 [Phytophthora cactorum]KAG2998211.1 hypothetical protein PC119_g17506 [Phytophthora cactorum]KAG3142864.1 hypothetical protein C6341_g19272 [Phytophthora cactorum]KAG3212479.1 hypothetical protein PC129_g16564 [Phytophthora cactorum]